MALAPPSERLGQSLAYTVFIAEDTFEDVAKFVIGVLGTGRRMTKIRRYVSERDRPGSLEVKTSLRLEVEPGPGWKLGGQSNPEGKSLGVRLEPGIEGFGFGYYLNDEQATEAQVRMRYRRMDKPINVTYVAVEGTPGEYRHTDRIFITEYNQHGVCTETTIAFEDHRA